MHIKQIIIQGFKSYKDQTKIEPFSPKHNVIVGRNGSGKSNFFAAIRFVLNDAYTHLGRREERQALLHEGTGSAVMSAFVEIIFDNSDDRFPTGKPELTLRRTIGIKKDEYSLDRKNATKADVMNLLESAGFSRSNPYYIVPQGRVTALTNMKDTERLTLLKEVAGTQVYEARRSESLKIMTETNNKRAKIDELLDFIKERLSELEEEKEELRDYQEKDKERRSLQYTIDHREQTAIQDELDKINEQRQNGVNDTDDQQEQHRQGEVELAEISMEISDLKQQADLLRVEKKQLEMERKEFAKAKAKVELDLKGLTDNQSTVQESTNRQKQELQNVQTSVQQREKELANLVPGFQKAQQEEESIKSELDSAEAQRQRLYAKQGRNSRFKSKRERDDWLRSEVEEGYAQQAKMKAVRMQTMEEIKELQTEISTAEGAIATLREQYENRGSNSETMQEQISTLKAEKEHLEDERKRLWREDAKLDSIVDNAQRELNDAERTLSYKMDNNTARGLAAVRRIKRQHNLDGVYGTLAELLEVSERFSTAVEVTAGNSLFHYVVDNDETATRVLEILQKERAGRVTFMPLNRLKPNIRNVPKANDSIPMIEKIKFDLQYEKAFQQVFGKTIICPDLTVAAGYARSHGVSAITMEGDRSDKKGALSGGYHDPRQSRLDAVRKVTKWRKEYDSHKGQHIEVKRSLDRIDQEITKALGELQKLDQDRQRQANSYAPMRQELQTKVANLQSLQDSLETKKRAQSNIEANTRSITEQASAHEAELSSDFKKALTREEETQLENLSITVQDLRRRYTDLSSTRSELESRKCTIEIELRENLRPYLEQLSSRSQDDASVGGSSATHRETQSSLKRITKSLNSVTSKLQELDTSINDLNTQITSREADHSNILQAQEELAHTLERQQKRMEKNIQKKSLLQKQAAEVNQRIQDLGVLPRDAFQKFERQKSEAIVKRLHKVNEALKKYSHVNKKAFQQYESFTIQRDTLTKRREELDSSQASIEELITVLDQRKDEAIERTFKQVSKEFANVFEKLVPAGRGRLIIQRKIDRNVREDDEEESDSEEDARRESVENYTGVGISVSFNSKHDEQQRIQQLSGGQKSLCALTLIFAIQRCDPAPFYLFDEIDANLDAQYRTAVAAMIQDLSLHSTDGQFICTTFRPEMVLVAQKCYGVKYVGKSSSVVTVDREEAVGFVRDAVDTSGGGGGGGADGGAEAGGGRESMVVVGQ
ncbi:Structural maintenance of chromosomes protein 3 [Agyrium rufum]|nr:Structural maintenance of chromosomes protein 3 [Agyrium rufum]